ncbi:hypothetical protein MMC32_000297, partial [Xylographa parallela]|nr:hypothetical protein [Xylographa parallela]
MVDPPPVSYDASTRTIQLHGPPTVAQQAKLELQHLLLDIRAAPLASGDSVSSHVVDHAWRLRISPRDRVDPGPTVDPCLCFDLDNRRPSRRGFSLPHLISSLMSRLKALKL